MVNEKLESFQKKERKMKAYSRNPCFLKEKIDDFCFLCFIPDCAYKSKVEDAFIDHAFENHSKCKASDIQLLILTVTSLECVQRVP